MTNMTKQTQVRSTVEALKLALEAFDDRVSLNKWQKARDAVREALAEQSEQNPETAKLLFAQYPEARQLPQIFIEGQRVGGLAGLQAALKQLGV